MDGARTQPGGQGEVAGDRDPGAHRREPVDGAEPQVRDPGEPLQVRVDHEPGHRDRPQPADDRVELPDRQQEHAERDEAEERDLRFGQLARRKLAARSARVPGVDAGVDQLIEPHRQRAGPDHRNRDPEQVVRRRDAVDREEGADVRKRQREDRVLELDERDEAPRAHVWR